MLPSLHSLLASVVVTIALALGAVGVTGASRSIPAVSPLDTWRPGAPFGERADWNPFANPDTAQRYRVLTAGPAPETETADVAAIANIAIDLPARR